MERYTDILKYILHSSMNAPLALTITIYKNLITNNETKTKRVLTMKPPAHHKLAALAKNKTGRQNAKITVLKLVQQ